MSGPKYKIGDKVKVPGKDTILIIGRIKTRYLYDLDIDGRPEYQGLSEEIIEPAPISIDEWAAMVAADSVYQKEGDSLFFYERVAAAIKKHWESAP